MGSKNESFQYCKVDEHTSYLPLPFFGLPCVDECPDGTYATLSHKTGQFTCDTCPANSYSIGSGGIRIDGTMGAFGGRKGDDGNRMPFLMQASCQVLGDVTEFSKERSQQ